MERPEWDAELPREDREAEWEWEEWKASQIQELDNFMNEMLESEKRKAIELRDFFDYELEAEELGNRSDFMRRTRTPKRAKEFKAVQMKDERRRKRLSQRMTVATQKPKTNSTRSGRRGKLEQQVKDIALFGKSS